MEWVRENWVFIMFFIIFIVTHFFGHGMHGGCGGGREHKGHSQRGSSEREGRREEEDAKHKGC